MRFLGGPEAGLKSAVVLRVIVTTILLGSGAAIYYGKGARTEAFYLAVVVAAIYFLSLVYLLLQPLFYRYQAVFKITQIVFDMALASVVVYMTGGRTSPFIFLYVLIIIYTSIILNKTASYITALVSGIIYILIVFTRMRLEMPPGAGHTLRDSISMWGDVGLVSTYFHLTGFLLIAILAGYLSERFSAAGKELGESARSLEMLRNLHEYILQSLTSGVITLDLQGKIISVNKTGLEILGIGSESEIYGKHLGDYMSGLYFEDLVARKREQMLYTTPGGGKLTLGFSSSGLKDPEGTTQGYIIIFQDLTEVKELEDRLRTSEKMALLGQLAAGLAHELRNPLSAISGAVEILSAEVKPTEENLRLSRMATQEVERLNLLVEDFLILTMPIQRLTTSVDLGLIVADTAESFVKTIRRSNIEIINEVQTGIYVQADSYKLKQALWNLLTNSVDAMPVGGSIAIESSVEDGSVTIEITDEGKGIDERLISRIFDPFFTTKEVGTGLGLAIVQKVIEGYNGKINVVSSRGKGATFVITLPRFEEAPSDVIH
ncbi:MAG: PAS domain S-box protein [Candidatus Dadabacteria bacterium]|nr:PAS domain S-box protein [Candidatus Dadabacteria bacterium]